MQAGLMLRSWPRFVAGCRRRYGKVFTLRISGIGTLVYVDDQADIDLMVSLGVDGIISDRPADVLERLAHARQS